MLYFAPIAIMGNHVYRHVMLEEGADYVFTELAMKEDRDFSRKIECVEGDFARTIFQIGASSGEDIEACLSRFPRRPLELNINMGCPRSLFQRQAVCSGLLLQPLKMREVAEALADICRKKGIIPSAKIRIGAEGRIMVDGYLSLLEKAGISKVYVHARLLGQSYDKPADHSSLTGMKARFPRMSIIVNGDITGATRMAGDMMIGRCALRDPFVFRQIKGEDISSLIKHGGMAFPSPMLVKFIRGFLILAEESRLPLPIAKRNLSYLMQGWSRCGETMRRINQAPHFLAIWDNIEDYLRKYCLVI